MSAPASSNTDLGTPRPPKRKRRVDAAFLGLCVIATSLAVLALAVLLASVIIQGAPALDAQFLTADASVDADRAGMRIPIIGSIILIVICAAVGIPLGVGTALFLEEFRPRSGPLRLLHSVVQTNIRNLAGVPSIVYGLLGLTIFVRMFGLFGNDLQYEQYIEIRTDDGTRIVGERLASEAPSVALDAGRLGLVRLSPDQLAPGILDRVRAGETIEARATLELAEDFFFIVQSEEIGELRISQFNLEGDAAGLEPFPPEPVAVTVSDLRGEDAYRVRTLLGGVVGVPTADVRDPVGQIDTVFVRGHRFTLASGEVVRGRVVDFDADRLLVVEPAAAEPRVIAPADVAAHTMSRRLKIGDEDWPLYIVLPFGRSVLAGGLTLMLVVLPIVIIAAQESIRAVPGSVRSASAALGATRWQTVAQVVLPGATPGILTGSILAMSRAIGETAPILVVGAATLVTDPPVNLMSSYSAMPLQIFNWSAKAESFGFRPPAAAGIIVLLVILLSFNAIAVILRQMLQKKVS